MKNFSAIDINTEITSSEFYTISLSLVQSKVFPLTSVYDHFNFLFHKFKSKRNTSHNSSKYAAIILSFNQFCRNKREQLEITFLSEQPKPQVAYIVFPNRKYVPCLQRYQHNSHNFKFVTASYKYSPYSTLTQIT